MFIKLHTIGPNTAKNYVGLDLSDQQPLFLVFRVGGGGPIQPNRLGVQMVGL